MTAKPLKSADITDTVLSEWKEKYGDVYKIAVADKAVRFDPHMLPADDEAPIEGGLVGYIRKPNDKELGFAMSKLPAFLEAGKVLVKNCWLGGDDELKTDPTALNAAALQVIELLEVRQAQLKRFREWPEITDESGGGLPAMYAIVRYIFPRIEPHDLSFDDLIPLWREAQYIIKTFKLITRDE